MQDAAARGWRCSVWLQRAAVDSVRAAGRAGGVVLGDLGEVGTALDGGFQFVALGFAGNQDVAGSGSGHWGYSFSNGLPRLPELPGCSSVAGGTDVSQRASIIRRDS